jgi:hypothetical protein
MYVNASCTCTGTKKNFPRLVRALRDAGVPESEVTIYNMLNASTNHPDMDKYPVTALPTFYFIRTSIAPVSVASQDTLSTIEAKVALLLK